MRILPSGGAPRKIIDMALIISGLTLAIPTCCAMYVQNQQIEMADLEDDIQEKMKERKLTHLIYNKGL